MSKVLIRFASALCQRMEARQKGTLLVVSSTAAMRGNGGQRSHVPAAEIAETYLQLSKQHGSTWTHELDLRAFPERPWWNH